MRRRGRFRSELCKKRSQVRYVGRQECLCAERPESGRTVGRQESEGAGHAGCEDEGDSDLNCVRSGAKYVMWDGRNAYVLSDQKAAEPWAGRKVRVLATLDAKTREIPI